MTDRSIPGVWEREAGTVVGSGCWPGGVGELGRGAREGKLRMFLSYV